MAFVEQLAKHGVTRLYFVSLIANFKGIAEHGILPKNEILRRGLPHESFAEPTVQDRRRGRSVAISDESTHNVHDLVPLYFTAHTPTLFARRSLQPGMVFICVDVEALEASGVTYAFADGNVASSSTRVFSATNHLGELPWEVIHSRFWTGFPDGKRKRNSEFLAYPSVTPQCFEQFIVTNEAAHRQIQSVMTATGDLPAVPVTIDHERQFFFNDPPVLWQCDSGQAEAFPSGSPQPNSLSLLPAVLGEPSRKL